MDQVTTMSTKTNFKEFKTQSLLFEPLTSTGTNFAEWTNDAMILLQSENIARAVSTDPIPETEQPLPPTAKWHTLMILRRHLDHALRIQYLHINDPADLWTELKARFDHQQALYLPQAISDWTNLRVLDFPNFAAYDEEMHRIISQLRMGGQEITEAEMIEKTLSTFPPATAILSQQYRNMTYTKYAKLMSHLLLAEKQHQILLRNAESRPAREVHNTIAKIEAAEPAEPNKPTGAPAGGGGSRRDNRHEDHHAEIHIAEASRRPPRGSLRKPNPKWHRNPATGYQNKPRNYQPRFDQRKHVQGNCHKCGKKGHFAKDCRASQYLVELYREVQQLRNKPRQNYNFEASDLPDLDYEVKNYMTVYEETTPNQDVALLDSGSTHIILAKA
jgi:hypothetical protein